MSHSVEKPELQPEARGEHVTVTTVRDEEKFEFNL